MYEEDRVRALSMYGSMFEETNDENALLHLLVSPTRQAVNLARAYDAGERKLQAQSKAREDGASAGEEPAFVQVIERLRDQAAALGAALPKVSDDQFSLFENAELDTSVFDDVAASLDEQPAEPAPVPAEARPDRFPDEDAEGAEPEAVPPEAAQPELPEAGDSPDAEPPADEVEAFLADFSIQGDELIDREQAPVPEEVPPSPAAPELPEEPLPEILPAPAEAQQEIPAEPVPAVDAPKQTVRKTRGFLLVLFLLLAIPLTLVCILILLLPTLLCLALAFSAVALGIAGLTAAFTSFSVIADILLVLGCALVVLALGLLLAWTFIWFVFGAIPGLIRGVISLGRRLCTKEVEVQ